MPTLVYKLKFEIDKSKIKGIDKIVSKDLQANISKATNSAKQLENQINKTSQASAKGGAAQSKHASKINDFSSANDRLLGKLERTERQYKLLERQDGLNAKSTQRKATQLRKLNKAVLDNAQAGSLQLNKLKLTDKEYNSLNSSIIKLYSSEERSSKIIATRTQKIEAARDAQQRKAQAEREAALAIQNVDTSLERLNKEYNSTIGGANRFIDSTLKSTSALKSSLKVYGDQHRATFMAQVELKKYIQTVEQQKRAVQGVINSGRLNSRQQKEATRTLTRLNTTQTQAVTTLRAYRTELKKGATSVSVLTTQQRRQNATMRAGNKSFAIGNQLAFSMGDLIQDAAQFNYGFATGMRAIGNNISFSAEMFILLSMQAKAAKVSTMSYLMGALNPLTVGLLALNVAITASTIISQRREAALRKEKEAQDELSDGISSTLNKDISAFSEESLNATEKLNILRASVDSLQKQLNRDLEAEFKLAFDSSRFEAPEFTQTVADNLRVTSENADNFVQKLKEADKQEQDILEKTREIILNKIAQIEAQELINRTLQETIAASEEQLRIELRARPVVEGAGVSAEGVAFLTPLVSGPITPFDGLSEADQKAQLERIAKTRIDVNKKMFNELFEDEDAYYERIRSVDAELNKDKINNAKLTQRALLSIASALSTGSKEIALAVLAVEKSLAIAEVIVEGQKRATQASSAALFFSANPLTATLGKKYAASAALIKVNTAAGVAAIAAQGLAQGAVIMRSGGASGGASGGGSTTYGVGANTQFLPTQPFPEQEQPFRAFGESIGFMPGVTSPNLADYIVIEQNVKGKDLALMVRAGNKELKSSQVIG